MNNTPAVRIDGLSRHFGEVHAVDNVTLDILEGEFFTMLGPSGSGKTTTLRLIAGFERPDSGKVFLHGKDVTDVPPYERIVNTVFQDYALFPHMTVGDNIAYGPKIRKVPPDQRQQMVKEMLDLVQMPGIEKRKPSQLSGGQRQRVALARALINQPHVLLLDEPLGALDLKLRQQMQIELKAIQQRVGITFVYVTHDQEEALTMSDRIAVFNGGQIEQVGSPADLYEHPATLFVAGFIGVSNLVSGEAARVISGSPQTFSIRPEKIRIVQAGEKVSKNKCWADGYIQAVVYLGMYTRYHVTLDIGGELIIIEQNLNVTSMDVLAANRRQVRLVWERDHNRVIVPED